MLGVLAVVASIGLADSLNPATIAIGLYLALGRNPIRALFQFIVGVFAVYFAGGVLLALGPGSLILDALPHPGHTAKHAIELGVGVALVGFAATLWWRRGRLAERELPSVPQRRGSSLALGAAITVVEVPTAFPYFAAIAAIVGSGADALTQVGLLLVFNVLFVLPLLLILGALALAGDRANRLLRPSRDWLQAHWPVPLAALAVVAGAGIAYIGATGLAQG